MKNDKKERMNPIYFHINPIDTERREVFVYIPHKLWNSKDLSEALKESVDLIFKESEGQVLN